MTMDLQRKSDNDIKYLNEIQKFSFWNLCPYIWKRHRGICRIISLRRWTQALCRHWTQTNYGHDCHVYYYLCIFAEEDGRFWPQIRFIHHIPCMACHDPGRRCMWSKPCMGAYSPSRYRLNGKQIMHFTFNCLPIIRLLQLILKLTGRNKVGMWTSQLIPRPMGGMSEFIRQNIFILLF